MYVDMKTADEIEKTRSGFGGDAMWQVEHELIQIICKRFDKHDFQFNPECRDLKENCGSFHIFSFRGSTRLR